MSARAAPAARLTNPDAVLTRSALRKLGYERRAVDVIFRALPTVRLPGYSRPMVKATDLHELLERCTSAETCEPAPASWALIAPAERRPPDFQEEAETDE